MTKQRDHTRIQLDQAREEQRKSKETISLLQRDVIDAQQKADNVKEDLNLKIKQVEKLEKSNRSQEAKVEEARLECSRKQASIEMYSRQRSAFDEDIRAFESSISELETSLQAAKNEKEDAHRELYSVTSKVAILEDCCQKARGRNLELEQQVANLKEGLAQLDSDLRNERSKCSQVESLYSQQQVEVDELGMKLEKATVTISALETDYEACLHERDDCKGKSSLSERKILELRNLLQKSEEVNNELDEKWSTAKGQTLKLEGQLESATKQRKQLKVELDEEKSKVSKLTKELIASQSRCSEQQRNVEWHEREFASKEKMIDDLRKALTLAEQKAESLCDEVEKLQCTTEALEHDKRELQDEALLTQKVAKEAETERALVTDENERLNSEIQSFYKRISEIQSNLNVCEREKYDFQQQGMVLQHKVDKLEGELQDSVKKISSFELLVQEVSSQNRKSEEAVAMYKGQSTDQQATCEELRKRGIEREALINQLRGTVETLNVELASQSSELSHCKAMVEDLEQDNKSMQNDLEAKQDEWFKLNAAYEATQRKKEQLEYELSLAEKKIANVEDQSRRLPARESDRDLNMERAKTVGLEKELSSLKMKLQLIESQSDVNQKDLHGVLEEIDQAGQTISSLRSEVERISDEKDEESHRAQTAESKCAELEREVSICLRAKEQVDEEVSMMEIRIAKYKSQVETLQKQKASVKEQLDAANDDMIKQKENIMCLETEVIEHKKMNEAMNGVISKKESLVQELRMDLGNTETDLNTLRQELISLKVLSEGLKSDRREDEQRVSSCQEKLTMYEQEAKSLTESRMALEQDVATAKFKTTSLQRQLEAALSDKEHYQSEYHNFQFTVRTAKEETLTTQNHLKEKERKCKAYVADLKQKEEELEKLRGDNVALRSELLEVRTDLETMRYNFENSQLVVQDLEASLGEANESISKLDLSIENLCQEKSEMSANIDKEKFFEVEALLRKSKEREQSLRQEVMTTQARIGEMATKLKSEQHKNIELNQELTKFQRKIHDSDITLDRLEREKRNLKEELLLANGKVSELEVKYEYQSRERESTEKQLRDIRDRAAANRDKLLHTERQAIEQRLALEFSQKELEDRASLTNKLRASKSVLEEQILSLRESLVESREMCEKMKRGQDKLERDYLDKCSSLAESDVRVQQVTLERDRILTESHSCMVRLSSVEQQVENVNKEKEHLLLRVNELKQLCSKHREAEENSQEKISELETRIGSLLTEISKKDGVVQGLNDENAFMGKEIEFLRKSLSRIESDYNSVVQRKREMESPRRSVVETNLNLSSEERDILERDVSVIKRQLAELEVNYKSSRDKEEEFRQNLVAANSQAAKWESQYGAVVDQKFKLEREMDSLKKDYASLKEKHQQSLCQVEFLQDDAREISNKISERDALAALLTKAKTSLERELQQKDTLLTTWENKLLQTQRELQEVRTLREHKSKEGEGQISLIESLTLEKKALETDVSTLRQELGVHQTSLNVAIRERIDAQKELFDVKKQISQYEFQLESCKQEKDDLQKELSFYRNNGWGDDLQRGLSIPGLGLTNTPLQRGSPQEYSSARQKDRSLSESVADDVGREQQRTIKILKAEIRSYQLELRYYKDNKDMETLKKNLKHLEAVRSQFEGEKQRHLDECISLRRCEAELRSEIDSLQQENGQMQKEIITLQKRLSDVQMRSPARMNGATASGAATTSVENLQFEYQLVAGERDECKRQITKLRKQLAEKEILCADTQREKEELLRQVSWGANRIEELERLIQDIEDQGNTLTNALPSDQQVRLASLENELETMKDRNSKLESYNTQCERRIGELNVEYSLLTQKLVKTEEELSLCEDRLETQKESVKTHHTNSKATIGLASQGGSEEIGSHEERQVQLEELLGEMRRMNEELKGEASSLQTKLWKEQQEKYGEVGRISNEKEVLEKEIDLLKRNLMLLRNNNETVIAEKEDLTSRFQELQVHVTKSETMWKLTKEENEDLKNELSNLRKSYSLVNFSFETLKEITEEPKSAGFRERTAELQELRIEKAHLNDIIRSLNAENSSIAKSYELEQHAKRDLGKKVGVLQTKILDLELTQSSLTAANDKVQRQLEISIQKVGDLECRNDQLREEKENIFAESTDLQQKLMKIEAENEVLRAAKARVEMECDGRSHRLTSVEAAHKASENRGKELQQNLLVSQRKTSELERELRTARVTLDSLNVSYEASENLVMSLTEETAQLGRKSSEACATHDRDLKRCKELEFQMDLLEKSLSSQSLQFKEACDDRDNLRRRLIETESKSEENCRQLEERIRGLSSENNRNEEMVRSLAMRVKILQDEVNSLREELSRKDKSSNKHRLEIEKLESELKESKEKSVTNLSLCVEKANLVRKMESELSAVKLERDAIFREKEVLSQQKAEMEREVRCLGQRISGLEHRLVLVAGMEKEASALKEMHSRLEKEYSMLNQEKRNLTMELSVQRDTLAKKNLLISQLQRQAGEMEHYGTKNEELFNSRERLIQEKLRNEKEAKLAREEAIQHQTSLEMKKKQLEKDLNALRHKYKELERKYSELIQTQQKLEEVTEIRVRSETLKRDESIYKLERDLRGLQSEKEYYEKEKGKKYASIDEMLRKITRLETENEYLRKHIFIAVESYDKAEKKLKSLQSTAYEPVITYQIRQAIREASGRDRCDSLNSSTASLGWSYSRMSSPRLADRLGGSPKMSSTPRPAGRRNTEAGDTGRPGPHNSSSPLPPRRSVSVRGDSSSNKGDQASRVCTSISEDAHSDSVFSSPEPFQRPARLNRSLSSPVSPGARGSSLNYPVSPGVTGTAFSFGSSGRFSRARTQVAPGHQTESFPY